MLECHKLLQESIISFRMLALFPNSLEVWGSENSKLLFWFVEPHVTIVYVLESLAVRGTGIRLRWPAMICAHWHSLEGRRSYLAGYCIIRTHSAHMHPRTCLLHLFAAIHSHLQCLQWQLGFQPLCTLTLHLSFPGSFCGC